MPVGWIISRVTSDTDRVAELVTWGLLDVTWSTFNILTALFFMWQISWQLTLIVLVIVPIIIVVATLFQRKIIVQYREVRKVNSKITGAYNETITGVRVIKALDREEAVLLRDRDVEFVGVESALLKGRDHIVGARDGFAAVGGGDDFRLELALVDHGLHDGARLLQPHGVHIHECDRAVLQGRRQQDVAAQVAGKDEAASPDQGDFWHLWFPSTAVHELLVFCGGMCSPGAACATFLEAARPGSHNEPISGRFLEGRTRSAG